MLDFHSLCTTVKCEGKVIWWWPELAKGVKLKFMAQIDFKCFSKVVKSRGFLPAQRESSIYQWDSPFFVTSSQLLLSTRHFEIEYSLLSTYVQDWNFMSFFLTSSRKCLLLNVYNFVVVLEKLMHSSLTGWLIKTWDLLRWNLQSLDRICSLRWRIYCILLFSLYFFSERTSHLWDIRQISLRLLKFQNCFYLSKV